MEDLNESLKEPVCIEEEIFFGPISDKEIKIRQQFENDISEEKIVEPQPSVENDISKNEDSLYVSFSVEESKYDSFDDSLNVEPDKKPHDAKAISIRKSFDKLKIKKPGFYDSLEDVNSLISNMDKCSISCEVESNSNLNHKQQIAEDSLRNPPVVVTNKSNGAGEQVHFDDDSLAILELENTFDDSLEEINDACVLSSIEDLEEIEFMTAENQSVAIKGDQKPMCVTRNLFDTSVEIVYEKKWTSDTAEQEESSDDKNMLYDSLSNSDFKDILKDSLEESDKCNENLQFLRHVSDAADANFRKTENMFTDKNALDSSVQIIYDNFQNVCRIENTSEMNNSECNEISKDSLENSKNSSVLNKSANECDIYCSNENAVLSNENIKTPSKKSENLSSIVNDNALFSDSSANQNYANDNFIITQPTILVSAIDNSSHKETFSVDCCHLKHLNNKSIMKDTVLNKNSTPSKRNSAISVKDAIFSSENTTPSKKKSELFVKDTVLSNENTTPSKRNVKKSSVKDVLPTENSTSSGKKSGNFLVKNATLSNENSTPSKKGSKKFFVKDPALSNEKNMPTKKKSEKYSLKDTVLSKENATSSKEKSKKDSTKVSDTALCSGFTDYQDCKMVEDISVVSDPLISVSAITDFDHKEEALTVDSCHLKLLNGNINAVDDLKIKLQFEVTVGDKRCRHSSQGFQVLPESEIHSKKCESNIVSPILVDCPSKEPTNEEKDVSDRNNSRQCSNFEELHATGENDVCDKVISNEFFYEKSNPVNSTNITFREKSLGSHIAEEPKTKFNFPTNLSNISLFNALDLHDFSSFLNESVIQSNDSISPLNLSCKDQDVYAPIFKDESKENVPEAIKERDFSTSSKKSPYKAYANKTPKHFGRSPISKDSSKKIPGCTKIPVRKMENFAIPVATPVKAAKQISATMSAEKVRKCQHSPHSAGKKTAVTTPNKTPHFCKVRNTIFSKVPQIVPSKKYMNIQSPVAQYIKNNQGPRNPPRFDPVLRDCMNQPLESPCQPQQMPVSGTLKSAKKKA